MVVEGNPVAWEDQALRDPVAVIPMGFRTTVKEVPLPQIVQTRKPPRCAVGYSLAPLAAGGMTTGLQKASA